MGFLEIKGLTKDFGGLTAVDKLDFHVNEGEILSLIGPNGAGKSTVFNLITSFLKPSQGSILFRNEDITHLNTYKIAAKGIIRIFQQNSLFDEMTVLQNVMVAHHLFCISGSWECFLNLPRAVRDDQVVQESASQLLEYFGLLSLKSELARGLPHGHKRALAMAIAMAAKPKLLLLDEPFAGMNPRETENAMKMVSGIRSNGITILLIEHDMKAVRGISDRVVVINFGQKIAEGIPDEILQNTDVINAYLGEEEIT
jgi:branched-chain amino acid transport system ATP-binding protein